MKKLTRSEMKKLFGCKIALGGPGGCSSDADCKDGKEINCNGTIIMSGPGSCYANSNGVFTCHYSVGC